MKDNLIICEAKEKKGMSYAAGLLVEEYYRKGYKIITLNDSRKETIKWKR